MKRVDGFALHGMDELRDECRPEKEKDLLMIKGVGVPSSELSVIG